MNIILLSGGSGKRLWPLSNDTRSKQFLKLLKNNHGHYESMVQRVYGQVMEIDKGANIVVATGASQVDALRSQLGDQVDIVVEPERRDTFPAIALAGTYLAYEKKISPEEAVLVLPVDPYADMDYFKTLLSMEEAVLQASADLVLMGIKPTRPSSQYGYMIPSNYNVRGNNKTKPSGKPIYRVERFMEKPAQEEALRLIEQGAFWNGGVFAFRLRYLIDIVKKYLPIGNAEGNGYRFVLNHYSSLKKISFDYEVVEKAGSIAAIPYEGEWKDLGTWNTLTEEIEEEAIGKVTVSEDTINSCVINELSIPVVVLGVKDLVVATSPDGILISSKDKSADLKTYLADINDRPMYGESSWGEYKVIDYLQNADETKSLAKHITIKAGRYIGYQAHRIRDEILTVVSGAGKLVLDGTVKEMKRGDVVYIGKGQKHSIKADDGCDLHCIEVQIGKTLTENDYDRFRWEW